MRHQLRRVGVALGLAGLGFAGYTLGAVWASRDVPDATRTPRRLTRALPAAEAPGADVAAPGTRSALPEALPGEDPAEAARETDRSAARSEAPLAAGGGSGRGPLGPGPRQRELPELTGGSGGGGGGAGPRDAGIAGGVAGVGQGDLDGDEAPDTPTADDDPGPDFVADESVQEAARLAEELQLVDPTHLEFRVRQRVPDGSLPPDEIDAARDRARDEILAAALLAEEMSQQYEDRETRKQARGLADTLLTGTDASFRERKLDEGSGR